MITDPNVYLVTVKLSTTVGHDPRNKVTGTCPAEPFSICTDVTGEHHTVLVRASSGDGFDEVRAWALENYGHVTRIEKAPWSIVNIN